MTKQVIAHRRVAEDAKRMNIFLSADPGLNRLRISRGRDGRKKKTPVLKLIWH
jgi:hypothetical protein